MPTLTCPMRSLYLLLLILCPLTLCLALATVWAGFPPCSLWEALARDYGLPGMLSPWLLPLLPAGMLAWLDA